MRDTREEPKPEEEDVDDPSRLRFGGERIHEEEVPLLRLTHVGEIHVVLIRIAQESRVVVPEALHRQAVQVRQAREQHQRCRDHSRPAQLRSGPAKLCRCLGLRHSPGP